MQAVRQLAKEAVCAFLVADDAASQNAQANQGSKRAKHNKESVRHRSTDCPQRCERAAGVAELRDAVAVGQLASQQCSVAAHTS